jgi:hypothetical protein
MRDDLPMPEPASLEEKWFATLGLLSIVYLKRGDIDGAVDIHAADGSHLARYDNEALARAAVLEQAMEPVSVH